MIITPPFPEELNRQFISKISKFHFAPTKISVSNLINEGIRKEKIILTGNNTVVDALGIINKKLNSDQSFLSNLYSSFSSDLSEIISNKRFVLMTGHRRENFGASYVDILKAIKLIFKTYPDLHLIFPVHLNPKVQKMVNEELDGLKNIHLLEPLNYPQFILLLKNVFSL